MKLSYERKEYGSGVPAVPDAAGSDKTSPKGKKRGFAQDVDELKGDVPSADGSDDDGDDYKEEDVGRLAKKKRI